jgi:1,4-dihydroxy-2-naphthoate octaprenyltransferase
MTMQSAPAVAVNPPLSAWLLAVRPKTLPAAVAPILVGTAVAIREGGFQPLVALVSVAVALLLQIVSNLANDLLDFRKGADTADRLGPTRVTQGGLIPPRQVAVATGLAAALAVALGLVLVWRGGWPILLVGAAALLAAVAYTGGPAPFGYLGLGEAFVVLFFGLAGVAGAAYVQTLQVTPLALLAAVPIGCLVAAILVVNNLRDIPTDRAAGKRTLAARFGPAFARREYTALLVAAYLMPLLLWAPGLIGGWWWLAWLTVPLAWRLAGQVATTDGRALNPLLGQTARLTLLFAVPFAASIIL